MIDFSTARVTVVGDVIEDHWIYGRVDRLSPEGPWPVFVPERHTTQEGGGANVRNNMTALGHTPWLVSPRRTAIKERYIAGRHQLFRVDREDTSPISSQEQDYMFMQMACEGPMPNVVVLSDYGKGCFSGDFPQRVIKWCNERGIKTVVDPKGDWRRYQSATIITPNVNEVPFGNLHEIMAERGVQAILRTEGADGVTLLRQGEFDVHYMATGPKVVDVVGAGDSIVAALASALSVGIGLPQAAEIANAAAGVAVGKPGTAVCTIDELRAVYSDLPKVGIANGCFDICHAGHVELLSKAAERCRKLIVAINSDASVARLKGRGRPINPCSVRAAMLGSLKAVDRVVIFDREEELAQIIKDTGASVIFKGGDYANRPVTGSDLARVEIIDTEQKSSTLAEMSKRVMA